ncbi:Regulator of protease activity HflC, stomatin/prohibitin superfamily [Pseudomonas sp. ok272]|uniref:prohibitin family protein n=1 Tax=unclassified Pseudomonas TaxID=196821 RepID=UPI0008B044AB|nr:MULTISPECIES: prohibitin family protein [unclassified Pseudomonas]SEN00554.1 Regulator of protease activity HflC, stomatin/prohibitin superfamily [Pseudomonas sp. ok272]SFM88545.1 Regulator of protease activity HflC, stomatin/prohibitin superfamily [Pseudomonas sp. ok602]
MQFNTYSSNSLKVGGVALSALVVAAIAFSSFYTVDEKERGVVLRNGALVGTAEPGLAFKIPLIETVKFISVQNQTSHYAKMQAYSQDQQSATLSVSVSWHVEPGQVAELYRSYGEVDAMVSRLISRQVPTQVENVFGRYTAIRAVQDRGQFVTDVANALKSTIHGPVSIDSVQIENIDFSDAYEKSIEERMKAEVQVKTREQMLATEKIQAQIQITQAQAEADSRLAQAKADAEATRLRGDAEADAIRARAAALASNQNLVELIKAERWDGKLPQTMLPNMVLPFLDAKK